MISRIIESFHWVIICAVWHERIRRVYRYVGPLVAWKLRFGPAPSFGKRFRFYFMWSGRCPCNALSWKVFHLPQRLFNCISWIPGTEWEDAMLEKKTAQTLLRCPWQLATRPLLLQAQYLVRKGQHHLMFHPLYSPIELGPKNFGFGTQAIKKIIGSGTQGIREPMLYVNSKNNASLQHRVTLLFLSFRMSRHDKEFQDLIFLNSTT